MGAAGEEATPTAGGVAAAPTRVDSRHASTSPAEVEERAQAGAPPLSLGGPPVVGPVAAVAAAVAVVEVPTRRSDRWAGDGMPGRCLQEGPG